MARTRLEYTLNGLPLRKLPAAALRACLDEGLSFKQLQKDLLSGLLVGILALPLAMALSIAIGLPPQHGLYTAIIAGGLTPLLGGSRLNIIGPTAAFVVILSPIVQVHGLPGLLTSGMMAGLILIGMGLLRMGRLIEYIPFPVTTGFTSGIAVVIAGLQLKDIFGLKGDVVSVHFLEKMHELWGLRGTFSTAEIAVSALTLFILLMSRFPQRVQKWIPRIFLAVPGPVLALPLAALFATSLEHFFPSTNIITLGERFFSTINGVEIPGIPRSLPSWNLPWNLAGGNLNNFTLSFETIRMLLPSAVTIAFLGAIESLLSAVVADGMARTRHEPDSELLALGLANFITPFFGGIPATGAIARTASNFRFGGRTPIAGVVHALTVLLAVLLLAPLLSFLPMSSMAALLLMVAWNMAEIEHFKHTLKVAPRSDSAVLLICFILTIAFDMVLAVGVGVLLGALFFIRRMAELTGGSFVDHRKIAARKLVLPEGTILYEINGPLFFGAAERAIGTLRSIGKEVKIIIFILDDVMAVDMTGLVAMEAVVDELKYHGIKGIIVGARDPVKALFIKGGLKPQEGVLAYANTLDEAIEMVGGKYAKYRRHVREEGVHIKPLHRQRTGAVKEEHQQG